jgi:hypothetical protein
MTKEGLERFLYFLVFFLVFKNLILYWTLQVLTSRGMPLCIPRQVLLADWVTVKQDAHFILQKHAGKQLQASLSTPNLRFRKPSPSLSSNNLENGSKGHGTYRILMRCNKLCLGEFNDRTELINQWRFLHPSDSDLAFDNTGQESMQRLWQSQMESLHINANDQTEQDFVRSHLNHDLSQMIIIDQRRHFLWLFFLSDLCLSITITIIDLVTFHISPYSAISLLTWPQ